MQRRAEGNPALGAWGLSAGEKEGAVDMAIALWVIVVVACCILCAWGLATAARRSREHHAQAAGH